MKLCEETCEEAIKIIKKNMSCHLISYPDPDSLLAKACDDQGISIYGNEYQQLDDWEKFDGTPWHIGWHHSSRMLKGGIVTTQQEANWALEVIVYQLLLMLDNELMRRNLKASDEIFVKMIVLAHQIGFGEVCHRIINGGLAQFEMPASGEPKADGELKGENKDGKPLSEPKALRKRY